MDEIASWLAQIFFDHSATSGKDGLGIEFVPREVPSAARQVLGGRRTR